MLNEIKDYLESGKSHYIRSYNINNRGKTEFCTSGAEFNYRMIFAGDFAKIFKGTNLTRFDEESIVVQESDITVEQYKQILETVKSYI